MYTVTQDSRLTPPTGATPKPHTVPDWGLESHLFLRVSGPSPFSLARTECPVPASPSPWPGTQSSVPASGSGLSPSPGTQSRRITLKSSAGAQNLQGLETQFTIPLVCSYRSLVTTSTITSPQEPGRIRWLPPRLNSQVSTHELKRHTPAAAHRTCAALIDRLVSGLQ